MPQLSWPNSTNFQSSVLVQIQSAKLEALLDEYNDTEMSTEIAAIMSTQMSGTTTGST